ncbi:MAG TPA: AI-2E family transporter [Bryobacteraceae bacterium]|nr:AI-2E family transporter [Bryobacteraceae bacterium]
MPAARDIRVSLGAWLVASAVNAAVVACLFAIGFAIAGVPWWLAVGLLCGVLNAVPLIGSLLSLTIAAYAGLFTPYEGWTGLLATGGVWLTIQIVEGFVLSPRAAARSGVNPFLSIPLVLAAGFLLGPVGAIAAVPVAAVLLIIWRARRSRRP